MVHRNNKHNILNEQEKNDLISAIKTDVRNEMLKSIKKWFAIALMIVSIIGFIGYDISCRKIYNEVIKNSSKFISETIAKKFAEPNIENTFKEVVKNESQEIMRNEILPTIESFRQEVKNELSGVTSFSIKTKAKMTNELELVGKEVTFLKQRNNITRSADKAIAKGEASYLNELEKIINDVNNPELSEAALSEVLRIKSYYATMTRVKGVKDEDMSYRGSLGIAHTYKNVSSSVLIRDLEENPEWIIRVKAAEKLANYKEKDVVIALLKSIKQDSNLEVKRTAVRSFEIITGYVSNDVFGYNAQEWWRENRDKIEEKLK